MADNVNTLNKELVETRLELKKIYLDPNNPSVLYH